MMSEEWRGFQTPPAKNEAASEIAEVQTPLIKNKTASEITGFQTPPAKPENVF